MTCVSEQGSTGLLWTVFEDKPFISRRIASFGNADEALQWIKAFEGKDDAKASEMLLKQVCQERDAALRKAATLRELLHNCPLQMPESDCVQADKWIDRAREELLKP